MSGRGIAKKLGMSAYHTIAELWNPKEAADRLYRFCEGLIEGRVVPEKEGPLSPAPLIAPRKGYQYTRNANTGRGL